ncbi:MAG: helix-turn-helix domain-containing protein [Phycisphaerae bacterium]|nr:helix-turn-helix domain-containing protein [Phycisphaerae bacterium]
MTNQFPSQDSEKVSGICSRLRFLREKHFGSRGKRKFADALGLPLSTYVNYEADRVPPSDVLVKVSEITGCDLNWLMTGQGALPIPRCSDPELSEILVRMEKIISSQPKAKQAVTALMNLLSTHGDSNSLSGKDIGAFIPPDTRVIPILGRVAAGEPAPWVGQDAALLATLASKVSHLSADAVKHNDAVDVLKSGKDLPEGFLEIIELCEPVTMGELSVDSFVVTGEYEAAGELFAVKLTGDSMEPVLKEGDYVIADTGAVVKDGATVLAELDSRVGAVCKLYFQESAHISLKSHNAAYEPIVVWKSQIKWIVTVIGAIRQ